MGMQFANWFPHTIWDAMDLFQNAKSSCRGSAANDIERQPRGLLVEQTGIFVVYFLDLDYLFPVNNRQKFRYELYAHTPHHRSLLLQYIDFQYT